MVTSTQSCDFLQQVVSARGWEHKRGHRTDQILISPRYRKSNSRVYSSLNVCVWTDLAGIHFCLWNVVLLLPSSPNQLALILLCYSMQWFLPFLSCSNLKQPGQHEYFKHHLKLHRPRPPKNGHMHRVGQRFLPAVPQPTSLRG